MSTDQASVVSSLERLTKKYTIDLIRSRCEKWYLDSTAADVHFAFDAIGSSTRLAAHKILLATDSDVFKEMFYGQSKENGDIRITDVAEATFKKVLQFFYFNEVEISIQNIAELMHLGRKYTITNCIDVCNQFLDDCLTADNILLVLNFAMHSCHSKLVKRCERLSQMFNKINTTHSGVKSNGPMMIAH